MIDVLSKPIEQISVEDIRALISSQVPEGEQIEFKENFSTKDQTSDPWMEGKDTIGNRAKNAILTEAVAFANAHGGALLIGIKQSKTKPPVAIEITPIPRCVELAERLRLVFRDCVEPQLSRLEIFSIPTDGEGGVVIVRLARSRLAPHRITTTRICPIRRADRREEMSMREIQDMTLNLSRGLQGMEAKLRERSDRFAREFTRLETPEDAFGIRITGVPLSDDIRIESVFQGNDIINEFAKPTIKVCRQGTNDMDGDLKSIFWNYEFHPSPWRPILRATRAEDNDTNAEGVSREIYYYELHCDGLVETGFLARRLREGWSSTDKSYPFKLYSDAPVSEFASLAVWANAVRNAALAPSTEYAIEVEIRALGGSVSITRDENWLLAELPPDVTVFPHYSLGNPEDLCNLSSMFERDFWNFLGKDIGTLQGVLSIERR